ARPRYQRLAFRPNARAFDGRARAFALALCGRLRRGRPRAVRSGDCRLRGANDQASISAGIVLAFLLLSGFGLLLQRLAARFRRTKPASLALALASISGPGSLARPIAVSLGLGLGLLVATALIHRALVKEIEGNIEVEAPAYYFLDVE